MSDVDEDDRLDAATLAELSHQARMAEVHTAIPGRVVSYDAATQRADVRPLVQRTVPRVDGGVLLEELPVVRSVPVLHPRAGGFFVHLPIAAGDDVLLVMSEADPARYLSTGQPGAPIDHRRHHLAHAFAIPGVHPEAGALAAGDALAGELVLGREGTGPLVRVTDDVIKLGRNATDKAAMATPTNARLDAIELALNAFSSASPISMDGGAAIHAAFSLIWDAQTAPGTDVSATVAEVE